MLRFRFDIAGEVQIDRGITRFAAGISDYTPLWPLIEEDFYALEGRQFETEGNVGGALWAPLSEKYGAWKEEHFPGKPILQRTGELMASLTTPNHPDAVKIEKRKSLTLGTRVPYAIFHQSILPRKRLPRRPEIQLTEPFRRTVMAHAQQYLVNMAAQTGMRTKAGKPSKWSGYGKTWGVGTWKPE